MNRYFILLLIAVSLLVSLGLVSSIEARWNKPAFIYPTPKPKPSPEIERIELDRDEAIIPCPSFLGDIRKDFDDSALLKVRTIVNNPKNLKLSFRYTVSGGKIDGQGENVIWNLKSVRPGTYTVTVAIASDNGVSKETKTREIKARECPIEFFGVCPDLSVTSNGNIKAGETVTFTANASGGSATNIAYKWTISQGEIVEGQGTSEIKVKSTPETTGFIKATVEIDGLGLLENCKRTESATAEITR